MEVPNGFISINGQLIEVYKPEQVKEKPSVIAPSISGGKYTIDNEKFGIKNDGTSPAETTNGINEAIEWAKSNGYNHVYLTSGTYSVKVNLEDPAIVIDLPSNTHFEMDKGTVIELVGNSTPSYRIFNIRYKDNVKISGGKIVGDKDNHYYEMGIKFTRGGVDKNGELNNDPNFIRSEVIDRKLDRGLLSFFRLWNIGKITTNKYSFYQYKDEASKKGFMLSRDNGGFAPASSNGRGWGGTVEDYNKMVIAIDISKCPLTDEEIKNINAKIDSAYYTHEGGYGIGIFASFYVEIDGVEISHCTGDGILTGLGNHYEDSSKYSYRDIGGHISISRCDIHHNRRQGISLCGPNDVHVFKNDIHHIGYNDSNTGTDFRNGTAPMFGIDIESMVGEAIGFPAENLHFEKQGLQVNYRILIENNNVHHNARGHFVNCDGTHVTVSNNVFEGRTIGHVSSYPNYWYVKYLNNTFIECDLLVGGNNFVNGAIFYKGGLRGNDPRGTFISNVQIREGTFSFSSVFGYWGTPTVNIETGTFTFARDTLIGSGGQVCFEQWVGKVPAGIDVNKTYWTVNATAKAFQVSETKDGEPVKITSAGEAGFGICRFNYGVLHIENVSVERGWRTSTASEPGFVLLSVGGTVKNVVIKNYDIDIKPLPDYTGRPISIDGLTLIEGGGNFHGCTLMNADFYKSKAKRLGGDIAFGSNAVNMSRKIIVKNAHFENVDVNLEGNAIVENATMINAGIGKSNSPKVATLVNSYLEDCRINFNWLTIPNQAIVVNNIMKNTKKQIGAGVVFAQNTDIETFLK